MSASSNFFTSPKRQPSLARPPMYFGTYMVLPVPGRNVMWPDSRRVSDVNINEEGVTSKIVDVDGREDLSAVVGWLRRWKHIQQRGDLIIETNGFCEMPRVRCREEAGYQNRVTTLPYDFGAKGVFPELSLDLGCLSRPFDSQRSTTSHRPFNPDLDPETRLRCDPDLGEVFVGCHNLEAFYF